MLKLWKKASNYTGENYSNYYVVAGQSRDSNNLEQSNFATALKLLGGEQEDRVIVIRSRHWAVGWIEQLLIREDDIKHIAIAEGIHRQLEDYSVLDDNDYAKWEYDSCLANIKDSLYQISDIDNLPTVKTFYSYFSDNDEDMSDDFYPNEKQLREAINIIQSDRWYGSKV